MSSFLLDFLDIFFFGLGLVEGDSVLSLASCWDRLRYKVE